MTSAEPQPVAPVKKQRKAYPGLSVIYALVIPELQLVARENGYALAIHGSMQTDIDLLACPWTDEATDADTLIEALRDRMNGYIRPETEYYHNPAKRSHGRLAWSIYFDEKSAMERAGAYLDVSVMPRQPITPTEDAHSDANKEN